MINKRTISNEEAPRYYITLHFFSRRTKTSSASADQVRSEGCAQSKAHHARSPGHNPCACTRVQQITYTLPYLVQLVLWYHQADRVASFHLLGRADLVGVAITRLIPMH